MILAIDPSLTSTGYALSDGAGDTIGRIVPKGLVSYPRLEFIAGAVERLLDDYAPDLVVYEGYAMGVRGGGRVFDIGELGGVLKFMIWSRNIRFLVVPPTSLKLFVTGSGRAEKEAMMLEASKGYGRIIRNSDEADAYGLLQLGKAFCDRRLLPRDRRHFRHRALLGCELVGAKS